MAVIVFRCSGCNRLLQLRENQRGVTTVGLCSITEGCRGELIQTDRLEDVDTPLLAENIPGVANRRERNVLYNHTQAIESSVWIVNHNLGTNPVVQVAVNRPDAAGPIEIEPDLIEIIDKNTTRITFGRNESGIAQCISRSSSSSATTTEVAEPSTFQLTSNGFMTIAFPDPGGPIPQADVRYIDSNGNETSVLYTPIIPPDNASPWADAVTVVLNGVEFLVATLDMTNTSASVGEGEVFYFDSGPFDMFILLSASPYQSADKVKRKVVFPEGIGAAEAVSSFGFSQGEHFAVDTLLEDVYPPVFVV